MQIDYPLVQVDRYFIATTLIITPLTFMRKGNCFIIFSKIYIYRILLAK